MVLQSLKSINWVDILILALAIRIIYISIQTGFVVEFLKLLGVLVTLFVCFHYYTVFAEPLLKKTTIPQDILFAAAFLVLWLLMTFVCKLIREGVFLLFKVEAQSALDRWGAAVIGVGRFLLLASMVMFLFLVIGQKYLQTKTLSSLSHKYILNVAPTIYKAGCDNIVSRLFPSEKYNEAVRDTLTDLTK